MADDQGGNEEMPGSEREKEPGRDENRADSAKGAGGLRILLARTPFFCRWRVDAAGPMSDAKLAA
jgi:hypothetical protein